MKNNHEVVTRFFENPSRDKFRELIQYNTGEYDYLDFKKVWPEASKLAKLILALANTGGGVVVVGVEENESKILQSTGLDEIKDKAIISNQVNAYIPHGVKYDIIDFTYEASEYPKLIGKSFQILLVEYNPTLIPLISKKEGNGIKCDAIYVRKGTSSVLASYEDLQRLLNNRIATNRNTSSEVKLEEHLAQLKLLYSKLEKYHYVYVKSEQQNPNGMISFLSQFAESISSMSKNIVGEKEARLNPNYPKEDYEEFIARMIASKKERIERILDV